MPAFGGGFSRSPFARGAGGYQAAAGDEPYLVIADGAAPRGDHCAFARDTAFAIAPGRHPGIIMISPAGQARPFASLPPGSAPSGIAFDATGRFGHRLLVTARRSGGTTVLGIGCDGRPSTVAAGLPPVEGGMAVAPATFGEFGGDLIAPDEASGLVYAVAPSGKVAILARSGLPGGRDLGVESAGFGLDTNCHLGTSLWLGGPGNQCLTKSQRPQFSPDGAGPRQTPCLA